MLNRHLEHCVGEGWGLEEGSGLGDESGMVSKWEWNVDAGWEYFQPPGRAGLERHNPAPGPSEQLTRRLVRNRSAKRPT